MPLSHSCLLFFSSYFLHLSLLSFKIPGEVLKSQVLLSQDSNLGHSCFWAYLPGSLGQGLKVYVSILVIE